MKYYSIFLTEETSNNSLEQVESYITSEFFKWAKLGKYSYIVGVDKKTSAVSIRDRIKSSVSEPLNGLIVVGVTSEWASSQLPDKVNSWLKNL